MSSQNAKHDEVDLLMARMREKNDEIRRRHQEVEEDRLKAENMTLAAKKPEAATKKTKAPPDPHFSLLFDSSRKPKDENNNSRRETRRHSNNYGGSDFNNVKPAIQQLKTQFKNKGIPKDDLTLSMTGRQRLEHRRRQEEMEEVTRARIQRQRTAQGTWKREWDAGKAIDFYTVGEEPPEGVLQEESHGETQRPEAEDLPEAREGKTVSNAEGKILVTMINKRVTVKEPPQPGIGRAQFRSKLGANSWASLMRKGSSLPSRATVPKIGHQGSSLPSNAAESKVCSQGSSLLSRTTEHNVCDQGENLISNATERNICDQGTSLFPQDKMSERRFSFPFAEVQHTVVFEREKSADILNNWDSIAAIEKASMISAFQNIMLGVIDSSTVIGGSSASPDLEDEIYYSDSSSDKKDEELGICRKNKRSDNEWEDVSDDESDI